MHLTIYCTVMCISCQYLLQPLTFTELCTMASAMPKYGQMPSVATGCKNPVSGSCFMKVQTVTCVIVCRVLYMYIP